MYRLLIFILAMLPMVTTSAAHEKYIFRTLSPEGGLCPDGILEMEQDGDGYVWVVTEQHLYRYDGTEYKKYYSHFEHSDSLDYTFDDITVTAQGKVLVSTNNGLFVYHPQTDRFTKVARTVNQTRTDKAGNLWLCRDKRWLRLPETADLTAIDRQAVPQLFDGKPPISISWAFTSTNDTVYATTFYSKIYRYTPDKQTFTHFLSLPDEYAYILEAEAQQGKLWVLTLHAGLYKIDIATRAIDAQYDFFRESEPRTLNIDKHGKVWIGTKKGIYVMNPDTGGYDHYTHDANDKFSLPNNSVWMIYEDHLCNLWIGGYAGSLSYVNLDEEPSFTFFSPEAERLNYGMVSTFAVDDHSFWIGTDGGGLNQMNRKTGKFTYYTAELKEHPLSADNIKSIVPRSSNEIWIGTFGGGLNRLQLPSGKVDHFLPGKSDDMLYAKNIRKIIPENDNGLWVLYQNTTPLVSYLDYNTGKFTHYLLEEEAKYLLMDMECSPTDNLLWIIGQKNLYQINRTTRRTKMIHHPEFDRMSLTSCCIDSTGILWIGTAKNGIVEYLPHSDEVISHDFPAELKGSTISSLEIDRHGRLWMGSDIGLLRYDPVVNAWNKYEKSVGTQGNVYLLGSAMRDKKGLLYFGGTNGFTIVDSDHIGFTRYKLSTGNTMWSTPLARVLYVALTVALLGIWMIHRYKKRKSVPAEQPTDAASQEVPSDIPQTDNHPQADHPEADNRPNVDTPPMSKADADFLQTLNAVIESHIDQSDISVEMLTTEMSCSRSKLFQRVKALTGKNIVQYVLSCRMRKAAQIVRENPNLTMREVMIEIGIESSSYFTKAFKNEFGESPTVYAKNNGETQKGRTR
ncbi:MAG: helix-turn-helix domain-containing protein [Prevotellaceae bacterium]|jgi:ligand-binding sensor domain-containing protein/AraC-like DNA-binding protein|nr:helix-turn-helix domain-containing protein [Prevotellaceae bacterium]